MALAERDPFVESFWLTPELPTPQIKGEVPASLLTPAMADMRQSLKNRLKLLELSREDELLKAIETSKHYCRLLRSDEFRSSPTASCHWKSSFTAESTSIPLIFELPMVLFTRAILLLNQAKCVLSRGRDNERIATAATLCREAAGIFDYILELMNANLMEGIEPPTSMPDLSLDVLQSTQGACLAIAQQLSIVKAVFGCEKLYSKSVLVKLHSGCHASFQAFEAVLGHSCSSSSAASSAPASPSRHAKTPLAFASFFAKMHKAQAFLLTAELEYQARNFGRAVGYLAAANKLFQERSSMGGMGLSPPPSGCERLAPLLSAKRSTLEQLLVIWMHENDSIYFDSIPSEETVLATVMPQAFIMKAQPFDSSQDSVGAGADSSARLSEGGHGQASSVLGTDSHSEHCGGVSDISELQHDDERIQVIEEHSDEEDDSENASDSDVYLERIVTTKTHPVSAPREPLPLELPLASELPKRESLIHALSDALRATHPDGELSPAVVVAPTRRQSERAPSMTAAQIAALAERASARKKSAGIEYKTEASKARDEMIAVQERLKAVGLQLPLAERERRTSTLPSAFGGAAQVELPAELTVEVAERMRTQLAQGKAIFRLAKDTRWRKETMSLVNDELVFMRKKPLLFSTQKRVSWSMVQAIQLEQGEVKDTHFILIVAKKGEEMTPFEITSSPPSDNSALFHYLHSVYQDKRKKSVQQQPAPVPPL